MITEDYVSFETAKLLKEKGFNERCQCYYTDNEKFVDCAWSLHEKKTSNTELEEYSFCVAPTLQMAMKWLREVHNLCIEPYRTASGYLYTISKIWTGSEIYSDEFNGDDEDSGQWTTYEKACEAAIKYCLENLI